MGERKLFFCANVDVTVAEERAALDTTKTLLLDTSLPKTNLLSLNWQIGAVFAVTNFFPSDHQ